MQRKETAGSLEVEVAEPQTHAGGKCTHFATGGAVEHVVSTQRLPHERRH